MFCGQLQLPFAVDPHGSAVSKRVGELPVTGILALISRFENRVGAISSLFDALTECTVGCLNTNLRRVEGIQQLKCCFLICRLSLCNDLVGAIGH